MNCQECTIYYYGFLTDADKIPSGALGHINSCQTCREQVNRLRNQLNDGQAPSDPNDLRRRHLQIHARLLNQWVTCDQVRPFMPALLLDATRVTALTPVTAHIEHCSQCRQQLKEIQSLNLSHEQMLAAGTFMAAPGEANGLTERTATALRSILMAGRSGIMTRVDAEESTKVKVAPRRSAGVQASRARSIRYLLTGSVAAAAVFLVIMLLPSSAIGNLENVNRAVKSVSEVHLQRYSEKGDLIQEIWVSKSLGFKIYKQPQKTVFKNMRSGQIVQVAPGSDAVYLSEGLRDDDMYARLLPFDQIRDMPPQYEWNFIEEAVLDGRRVHVYELTWQHPAAGFTVSKKWKAALDARTHLPYRIEWFEKMQGEQDYVLMTRSEVQYPAKGRLLEQLDKEGFQRFLAEDHVE